MDAGTESSGDARSDVRKLASQGVREARIAGSGRGHGADTALPSQETDEGEPARHHLAAAASLLLDDDESQRAWQYLASVAHSRRAQSVFSQGDAPATSSADWYGPNPETLPCPSKDPCYLSDDVVEVPKCPLGSLGYVNNVTRVLPTGSVTQRSLVCAACYIQGTFCDGRAVIDNPYLSIADSMWHCPRGTWCPNTYTKLNCPAGYFCRSGSARPTQCFAISICPAGSSQPQQYLSLLAIIAFIAFFLLASYLAAHRTLLRAYHDRLVNKYAQRLRRPLLSWLAAARHAMWERHGRHGIDPAAAPLSGRSAADASAIAVSRVPPLCTFPILPPSQRISVTVQGLTAKLRKTGAYVLQSVDASFEAGKLHAIMGPSGCGKTTLMTELLGRTNYQALKVSGKVFVNGAPARLAHLREHVGFVPQDDVLPEELTVHDVLRYAECLRGDASESLELRLLRVEEVERLLDIRHVRHSFVGSIEKRGISGGQRKRVSVGMELVARPTVLVADELTTGLDATTAYRVMSVLKRMCAEVGMTIIMSIHQPRHAVFELFDNVVVMSQGSIVFQGTPTYAITYMQDLGFQQSMGVSAPDFVLDIISGLLPRVGHPSFNVYDLVLEWRDHNAVLSKFDANQRRLYRRLQSAANVRNVAATVRASELRHRRQNTGAIVTTPVSSSGTANDTLHAPMRSMFFSASPNIMARDSHGALTSVPSDGFLPSRTPVVSVEDANALAVIHELDMEDAVGQSTASAPHIDENVHARGSERHPSMGADPARGAAQLAPEAGARSAEYTVAAAPAPVAPSSLAPSPQRHPSLHLAGIPAADNTEAAAIGLARGGRRYTAGGLTISVVSVSDSPVASGAPAVAATAGPGVVGAQGHHDLLDGGREAYPAHARVASNSSAYGAALPTARGVLERVLEDGAGDDDDADMDADLEGYEHITAHVPPQLRSVRKADGSVLSSTSATTAGTSSTAAQSETAAGSSAAQLVSRAPSEAAPAAQKASAAAPAALARSHSSDATAVGAADDASATLPPARTAVPSYTRRQRGAGGLRDSRIAITVDMKTPRPTQLSIRSKQPSVAGAQREPVVPVVWTAEMAVKRAGAAVAAEQYSRQRRRLLAVFTSFWTHLIMSILALFAFCYSLSMYIQSRTGIGATTYVITMEGFAIPATSYYESSDRARIYLTIPLALLIIEVLITWSARMALYGVRRAVRRMSLRNMDSLVRELLQVVMVGSLIAFFIIKDTLISFILSCAVLLRVAHWIILLHRSRVNSHLWRAAIHDMSQSELKSLVRQHKRGGQAPLRKVTVDGKTSAGKQLMLQLQNVVISPDAQSSARGGGGDTSSRVPTDGSLGDPPAKHARHVSYVAGAEVRMHSQKSGLAMHTSAARSEMVAAARGLGGNAASSSAMRAGPPPPLATHFQRGASVSSANGASAIACVDEAHAKPAPGRWRRAVLEVPPRVRPSFCAQLGVFMRRAFKQQVAHSRLLLLFLILLTALGAIIGLLFGPNSSLSDLPLKLLLAEISLSLVAAAVGMQQFVGEKLLYYRERAGGTNSLAYFMAKNIIHLPVAEMQPIFFLITFTAFSVPSAAFLDQFLVLSALQWAASSIGMLMGIIFRRDAAVAMCAAVMLTCLFSTFNPRMSYFQDDLKLGRTGASVVVGWSYVRWTSEALFVAELKGLTKAKELYSESALRDLGYSKSNFWWPCLVAPIIIGIVLRVFAYLYLIWTQRAMQATQQLWMRAPKLKPGQRPTL